MKRIKPAHVVLQVVSKGLNVAERDRAVHTFWDDLTQLDLTDSEHITPLKDASQGDTLYGLEVRLPQPERLEIWIQDISDRLESGAQNITIRLTCTIDCMRVQMQTASAEELLSLVPVVNMTLPARQIFQARAETYASREGEFSPVEEENLKLLCYQLHLDPDVAEEIKEQALGPYQSRPEKLEKYREVLIAELERHPPPISETTQAELSRLREALGLSPEDVEAMTVAEIAERQPVPEEPEEIDPEEEAARQRAILQQKHAEQYRQLFAETIARTLDPREFDRGRLEQARRTWDLDRELIRAIEREVTDERYGPTDSGLELDYTGLRRLLWQQRWADADRETERLILSALSHDMQPLSETAMLSMHQHCVDLQTLDQLWSRYSQGKFGFTAQYQTYAQQDRQPGDFLAAVEWVEGVSLGGFNLIPRSRAYRDLQFDLQAPAGHLPTWRWAADSLEGDYLVDENTVQILFHEVVEKCLPHLKNISRPVPTDAGADEP